jgi:putative ABC transport system permease protein
MMPRTVRRLLYLARLHRMDADLKEELQSHQAMKQAELERSGMPTLEAAYASRRALGNATLAREDARAVWISRWLDDLARDLGYAVRGFRRNPGFTAVALLTLMLGIGANSAILSVVYAVVLNPFPFPDAERFVNIRLLDKSGPRPLFLTAHQLVHSGAVTCWRTPSRRTSGR